MRKHACVRAFCVYVCVSGHAIAACLYFRQAVGCVCEPRLQIFQPKATPARATQELVGALIPGAAVDSSLGNTVPQVFPDLERSALGKGREPPPAQRARHAR